MPNSTQPNGDSTVHDWLMHIDNKLTELHEDVRDKLDTKTDKADTSELEERIEKVDKRTNKIELRMAGIAGVMATGVLGAKAAVIKLLGF